ncbi:MAG: biotin--[acetyl-CoA-carboxylase] ligase [Zetaproteobacteria bacterium CG12_big_fil_rev_8_21_14_0_65_55_1124]|nr:MAG: biotin--[acetyl-CoA-carboxylase] ligase [Zetaproteobacteria bacterium CG1_02_55_237]PIS18861.1 MAG: biotin--[acetyl-CoA-carboxylase] ligase [Zetaproteobacteria bacterium CG08_land_8_20_14_0_20_55_17]PIW42778.1 MAG: biotin--[acetyl-CoA-carboxylase] ligase [Zetaproteobacteria bacterium CG12_big_fil_rev_8_21_14_0_65_55_1124]PIY51805.1 MAG: biotin--[acetyl-CoA-carboxylase] ligase [Zetaproteobacteria bacterium CG_4_10_14_0_8_um_filter_55_43]PIZ40059.1 MAG: biotin--[acetyl-CoA-carboxylase] li
MHATREALLHRLSSGDKELSGEELAGSLGISRTAVWKHVHALQAEGLDIRAERGRGYRLYDDVLVASLLAERLAGLRIGSRCMLMPEVDSTNSELMRLATEEGGFAPDGTVLLAERQTRGRGRLQRNWLTTAQHSLAMSVLLRPPLAPTEVAQLPLLTAVAVQQALADLGPLRIKWPNDILCEGRKLAGILTEMRAEPGAVHAVVIGIGINVRAPEGGWPEALGNIAGDLSSVAGREVCRMDVATAVLRRLDALYNEYLAHGFEPIREAWWQAHAACGQSVRVHNGTTYIDGIAEALDTDGALLLRTSGGVQRIIAGDLELREKQ